MSLSLFLIVALENNPTTNEMNEFAKSLNVEVQYENNINLKEHGGFIPATLRGNEAGCEFHYYSYEETPNEYKNLAQTQKMIDKPVVYQLRFGGVAIEGATAFATAIIFANKYNAIVIEGEGGEIIPEQQLTQGLEAFIEMSIQ